MHHILALFWFLYLNYVFRAFMFLGLFLLVCAVFGFDVGFHKNYVKGLLKMFEFCRYTIEKRKRKKSRQNNGDSDQSSGEELMGNEEEEEEKGFSETRRRILSMNRGECEPHEFHLSDAFEFVQKGVHDIVDDEVTKRFDAEEIRCWNLLTRTNRNYQFISLKLTVYWLIGFFLRFYILFPIRLAILAFGMIFLLSGAYLTGFISDGPFKRWLYYKVSVTGFRILSRTVSAVVTYHHQELKPKGGGICVANHTTPLDVVMLHCDNAYALVGQLHEGFLGIIERGLNRATSHVFFERSEVTDRLAVTRRMKHHISDSEKLPILIFPEGTCINNSAVMMFKKGSFEVASLVYPVAIKYDHIFGDPFWNSSKYGYFTYLLMMMTSWAIVCDVWYMPPMTRRENEPAIDFANRVKAAIARQGGLVDLQWDGQLKRNKVRPEMKAEVQRNYSRKISLPNQYYQKKMTS